MRDVRSLAERLASAYDKDASSTSKDRKFQPKNLLDLSGNNERKGVEKGEVLRLPCVTCCVILLTNVNVKANSLE